MKKSIILLCERLNYYKGIERELSYSAIPNKTLKKIFNFVNEDGEIPFSVQNLKEIKNIHNQLTVKGIILDIIVATDDYEIYHCFDDRFSFLGYDVSGDSYFHSPIFRLFYDKLDYICQNNVHEVFKDKLNKNGLFSSKKLANDFIKIIFENKDDFFEPDDNIRPIKIFEVK